MLSNQNIALVSGSTRGIGEAIATRINADGFVALRNSRRVSDIEILSERSFYAADVTLRNECQRLVSAVIEEHGKIDLLVCNVGSGAKSSSITDLDESWDYFLAINLKSTVFLVEAALPHLIRSKGQVIAISSICASDPSVECPIEYASAKAALEMYIKKMARKYAPQGVRFNAISPGNVMFKGSIWETRWKSDSETTESYLNANVPLRDFIDPTEIAEAVAFLANPRVRNITGVILPIDGGQSI